MKITLTTKQKQVADEFIITGNKTESYLKYYKNIKKRETAASAASRLFNLPEVKEYVEERLKILDEDLIMDQREILRALTRQARRQETDYQVFMVEKPTYDEDGKFLGIVKSTEVIETPTQNKDAIRALELLGKRFGMWTERIELNEPISITIKRKETD